MTPWQDVSTNIRDFTREDVLAGRVGMCDTPLDPEVGARVCGRLIVHGEQLVVDGDRLAIVKDGDPRCRNLPYLACKLFCCDH